MVSKPKPGLGKGLVRLAQHQHQQPVTASSHAYHHSLSHLPSSSSSAINGGIPVHPPLIPIQPLSLGPIVSHHQSSNRHVTAKRGDYFGDSTGTAEREGGSSTGWPLLPAVPPASTIVGTPAYLALLPIWETASFSASDALIGRFSEQVVTPYRHRPTAASSTPGTIPIGRSRRYTTSSAPLRAAVEVLSNFTQYIPPPPIIPDHVHPWYPRSSYAYHNHVSAPNPTPNINDFFFPPPPPPSPGPARPPSQAMNPPRPSETHTVLSPAPLDPGDIGGGEGGGGMNGIIGLGVSPYLSSSTYPLPTSITSPPKAGLTENTHYSSNLIFRLGASGLAKDRPILPPRSTRSASSPTPPPRPRSFPLPEIKAPSQLDSISIGEDAYFAQSDGICVADGVGGWARSGRGGADAGRWSRLLTHFCQGEVRAWWSGAEEYCEDIQGQAEETGSGGWKGIWRKKGEVGREGDSKGLKEGKRRRKLDPVEVMQRGFEKCLACVLSEGIYGSSTCLLALLHHSSLLVANLGDCCLLLVRNGEIVFRTNEMQHAFNFPLQVGTHSRDEPMKDAKRFEVTVEERDVVVVGSDGLMDNLFDEDILDCLAQFAPPSISTSAQGLPTPPDSRPNSTSGLPHFSPQKVSEALCAKAREVSEEPNATTPFMMRAIEEGIDFVGGKKDDISVVVGVIGSNGDRMELKT